LNAHEQVEARALLEADLLDCGVSREAADVLGSSYARAISASLEARWIEFYVAVFTTLSRSLRAARAVNAHAVRRLLYLVNDDLGAQLFDVEAREHLAARAHHEEHQPERSFHS
jgi:hypothetical protein